LAGCEAETGRAVEAEPDEGRYVIEVDCWSEMDEGMIEVARRDGGSTASETDGDANSNL